MGNFAAILMKHHPLELRHLTATRDPGASVLPQVLPRADLFASECAQQVTPGDTTVGRIPGSTG